jgi:hypothetical protein
MFENNLGPTKIVQNNKSNNKFKDETEKFLSLPIVNYQRLPGKPWKKVLL